MVTARYKPLVDAMAADIRSGRLSPGSRLPTHRQLAEMKGVALVTASRIYKELEIMGLVSSEAGRGTFVRETALPFGHGVDQTSVSPDMIDLNFNYSSLPGQADLMRETLRKMAGIGDMEALLRYQPHAGRTHERAVIADHLARQDISVEADRIVIVSGAQHGISTCLMALLSPGDVVAVDALTYPGFKVAAEAHRLELVPIPMTGKGPDLDMLERVCRNRPVKAVYTMPTLHNPLGTVMPLQDRHRLTSLARDHDLLILEDAAYAFLEADPPPPLISLAPERTVHISCLSKSVSTGLRVGYLAAPPARIPALERAVRATTWNTPGLMTAIACEWIRDGSAQRLEREKRKDASDRQRLARDILAGLDYAAHPASYFLWLRLREEVRADRVVMDLMHHNIAVSTAEPFATTEHVPHALRLALGSTSPEQLELALKKVREIIAGQTA